MGGGRSSGGYGGNGGRRRELTGIELGRQGDAISNQVSLLSSPTKLARHSLEVLDVKRKLTAYSSQQAVATVPSPA